MLWCARAFYISEVNGPVIIIFHASLERECIYSEVAQDMLARQESRPVGARRGWAGLAQIHPGLQERADKMWKLTDLMPDLPFNGPACF